MTLESFLLDLILVSIIGVSVYLAARRGFVRTFVEALGVIAATIMALTVCTPLASITYDKIIEPPITKMVADEVNKTLKNENFDLQLDDSVNKVIEALPIKIQSLIEKTGIEPNELLEDAKDAISVEETVENNVQKLVFNILKNSVKPLAVRVISYLYAFIIFLLLLIVVKILAKLLNKVFSFSIVGRLNTALGSLCGLAKGIIFALLLCLVIYSVAAFTENGIWIFNVENIDKTFIFKYLISLIKI
ncbi:MAG: CvpA family protein [Clostridia bacterium]|nr:CvpA family protein [Clostridia bacterium]